MMNNDPGVNKTKFSCYINPNGEFKWGRLEASLDGWEKKIFTSRQLRRIKDNIKRLIVRSFKNNQ